ncbi:hypothetical protein D3C81_307150 [compost metagenome]
MFRKHVGSQEIDEGAQFWRQVAAAGPQDAKGALVLAVGFQYRLQMVRGQCRAHGKVGQGCNAQAASGEVQQGVDIIAVQQGRQAEGLACGALLGALAVIALKAWLYRQPSVLDMVGDAKQ